LGTDQYRWLAKTLKSSSARYKFVFIHQLIGGATSDGRGGIEVAGLYEWGGRNTDGDDEFAEYRPGWPTPIHPLLKQHGVSALFHGHDHLYVKQDLDGIVYQETPQPGDRRGNVRTAAEYGYTSGTILPGSGHLRVHVAPEQVTVEYVRACLSEDERPNLRNADIGDSYRISGRPVADPRSAGNRLPGPAPSTAGRPD
jgi:hypothetical protein